MQILTSLSSLGTTLEGLEARQDASLVLPSAAEPLNALASRIPRNLSPSCIGEGKHDLRRGEAAIGRIPVVSTDGTRLMPCKPAKARKLIRDGKAVKKWSKLSIFYIQLKFNPQNPSIQPIAVGVDPGSKFEGLSSVGTKDTVLNIMSEAVHWVKRIIQQRREMRRARRYRKTRCRPCRGDNRLRNQRNKMPPPSTKARWDAKLRIIRELARTIPISTVVVEDIKAETRKGQRRWNENFSPLEVGKQYFYSALRKKGLEVVFKSGRETEELRTLHGLEKIAAKSKPVFESHCVDAWCLAASVTGAQHPTTKSLHYLVPLRWHRRQLHKLQPSKGAVRRREGGTISLGLKKGTLVKHIKYGFCYIGGNMKEKLFSLHSLKTGRRITQRATRKDFEVLTKIAFRTQFLPPLKQVGFLE